MDIYETKNSQLIIGPFEIDKIKYIEKIVIMPDQFILEVYNIICQIHSFSKVKSNNFTIYPLAKNKKRVKNT